MPESVYLELFDEYPFGTQPLRHYAMERPELEELYPFVVKGSRVLLEGPRRIGKTLLVKSAVPDELLLLIDLKGLTSEERVVNGLRRALERFTGASLGKTQSSTRSTEAKLSASLGYLRGRTEERLDETDLDHLFGEIDRIGRERVPLIVFFDEIQTLMEFDGGMQVAERIRALSQHHEHVGYFFAGSNSHLLARLTDQAATPFYKQLNRVVLRPLDRDPFGAWIRRRLADHGSTITEEALEFAFRFARDIPGDVQRVLANAFALAKARASGEPAIDLELLDFSIVRTLSAEEASLDIIVSNLNRNKRMLLLAIAAMLHTGQRHPVTGKTVRHATKIGSPGTIDSTREALADAGLISLWNKRYQIDDPFLEAYLIRRHRIDYDRVVERLAEGG